MALPEILLIALTADLAQSLLDFSVREGLPGAVDPDASFLAKWRIAPERS